MVQLKDLLVSDRVKSVLSESMVNHVWHSQVSLPRIYASSNELAYILDKYCANFDQHSRPLAGAKRKYLIKALGLLNINRRFYFSQPSNSKHSGSISYRYASCSAWSPLF